MSFTKIARRNAQLAKREAQQAAREFVAVVPLAKRPESLMAALYKTPIAAIDGRTSEVLMVSPRAAMPHRADQ